MGKGESQLRNKKGEDSLIVSIILEMAFAFGALFALSIPMLVLLFFYVISNFFF